MFEVFSIFTSTIYFGFAETDKKTLKLWYFISF